MSLFSTKLRKASYNGVSFEVTSSTVKFGRRTVTHEYPQRDEPYTEDLGRSARSFDISGLIVGPTYIAQTKRLLKALEQSSETNEAGKLVHPWMGTLRVYVNSQPKIEWKLEQGVTNFTINFVEAGNLNYPTITEAWGNKLRSAVDSFVYDCLGAFGLTMEDIEDLNEKIDYIANGSFADILGALQDSNLARLFDLGDSLSNLADTATQALSLGAKDFAKEVASALGLGSYINSVRNWRESSKALIDVIKDPVFSHHTHTLETDTEKANSAVTTLSRQIMLANLAGSTSVIGTKLDSQDDSENELAVCEDDEVRTIRNEVLNLLIEEQTNLGTDESELYNALDDLIINVYHYLTESVLEDNQLIYYTPKNSAPAVTIAYNKYEDSNRADEIVSRNNIINPLFTPSKTLKLRQN